MKHRDLGVVLCVQRPRSSVSKHMGRRGHFLVLTGKGVTFIMFYDLLKQRASPGVTGGVPTERSLQTQREQNKNGALVATPPD